MDGSCREERQERLRRSGALGALPSAGLVLVLAFTSSAHADTIVAASGSVIDLQAAVDAAAEGDTVAIPAGTFTFVGTVTINQALTLQGSGDLESILAMENGTGDIGIQIFASDVTVRNLVLRGHPQGSGAIRDYGLQIADALDFRVLDCELQDFGGAAIIVSGAYTRGVIADCRFIDIFRPEIDNHGYGVLVNGGGSTNWNRPFVLGNDDSVFVEDCYFIGNRHSVASNNGSRYVFRHNFNTTPRPANSPPVDAHGLEYGSERGSRGYEVYGNTLENFTATPGWCIGIGIRGGDGVVYDNVFFDGSPGQEGYDEPLLLACRMDGSASCTDYVVQDQTRELYAWNNTLNGEPVGVSIYSGHECLLVEDRDYYAYERPGYAPYTYPHPLRDPAVDADVDGYPAGVDCDDDDFDVHPGAVELCNEKDDNCVYGIDEGCPPPEMELRVVYAPVAVVVDGDLSEFDAYAQSISFADSGRGAEDNSAEVMALWDDTYLYVAYRVADTKLNAQASAADTSEIWMDDNLEIYIDRNNDHLPWPGSDDFHVAANLNDVVTAFGQESDGDLLYAVGIEGTVNDNGDEDVRYRIELAMRWSFLAGAPAAGDRIGIDFCAADRDTAADGYQYYDWASLSDHFRHPELWGDIIFEPMASGDDGGPPGGDHDAPGGDAGGSTSGDLESTTSGEPNPTGGCGCAAPPTAPRAWLLVLAALAGTRRRWFRR